MTDFDDILKKGKKSVSGIAANPDQVWKNAIGAVLYVMQELNDLYGDPNQHYIQSIDRIRCYKCNKVTYLIAVLDLATKKSTLRFHASDWSAVGAVTYACGKCQSPKP